jgi:hypothetical protein
MRLRDHDEQADVHPVRYSSVAYVVEARSDFRAGG